MSNHNNPLTKNTLEIINLLKRIHTSKQLISISFKSLPHHCLTSLLEIHHEAKVLVFDEPNPPLSNKLITAKNSAEFSLKLDQLPVSFETEIISTQQIKGFNRLYTHYPKKMYYPQNRTYYHFRTEFINGINASIFLSSTNRLECELINISLDGICLRLPYSFAIQFKINQLINDISIQLPGEGLFSVSAKVQNTRIEKNYATVVIGLLIEHQNPHIEKMIQRFIFRAKRDQIPSKYIKPRFLF